MIGDDKTFIDHHLNEILKASGSSLKNYSLHQTREGMRKALRAALAQRTAGGGTGVATLQFLTDVATAAGLLSHGKTDKGLARRISEGAYELLGAAFGAQPVAGAAAQAHGWDAAIEAAAEEVIYHTQVPLDLLGPAQPSHKALAATSERLAEAIRALRPAAPTAQPTRPENPRMTAFLANLPNEATAQPTPPATRSFCGGHALAVYDPDPPLDWRDQGGACSICGGTGVTFGKRCTCAAAGGQP